jgi:hypothetical protein
VGDEARSLHFSFRYYQLSGIPFFYKILIEWHVMERRDFIRQMGLSLAGGWAFGKLVWPIKAWGVPELRLAFLSDAHLRSGDENRPEAQTLARAVAEIKVMSPAPTLALFAGDLAHQGRPDALDLGREILSELAMPLWVVSGEGDCGRAGIAPWTRRFGPPRFSRTFAGVHFLGLDIPWRRTPDGAAFEMGPEQRTWLARELAAIDSGTPLVIVSHVPLGRLFLPWQQWTGDAPEITALFNRFRQVLCVHGHVHALGTRDQGQRIRESNGACASLLTGNQRFNLSDRFHLSLPATAWPQPSSVLGTPAVLRPGQGPQGCGWSLVTLSAGAADFQPYLWQA